MARSTKVQTGDYIMPNDSKERDGTSAGDKMLVNIGEHRKAWIKKVADLTPDSDMTEVLRCIVDQVLIEDPESYAVRVQKWRLKSRLEALEAKEREVQEEKQRLVQELESQGSVQGSVIDK